ncbi:serine/threonine-protein kinase [Pseudonocardia sp. TRM90224]|uniref:serine/threonine-protein kinase n=1 Tax=Pseudonocardia sp. TRM90224 TaxID=2812678 RepID=UPI001E446694|nr:serine/threonine-protein kinase [Pseudonocardia sp. TRM90224]
MRGHEIGRLLDGRYRLHELIGHSGTASVWRATDELLGRDVALKRVQVPDVEAGHALDRTMREARTAAALHHPNIVTVFNVLLEDGVPWLVMEYLPSRSLRRLLAERGALVPQEVAFIGARIAVALAVAHEAGVVHRDVTPDNILIGATGLPTIGPDTVVKLADFGISHATTARTVTATGVVSGTPAYIAPETARGGGTGPHTDVYSLGATLFAALDGLPPFGDDSENVLALLSRIASGGVPAPVRAGPLTGIIRALTADDPRARPTAAQAHAVLHGLVSGEEMNAPHGRVDALPRSDGGRGSRRWGLIGAGAAVLVAVAVAVLLVPTGERTRGDVGAAPASSTGAPPEAAPYVDPESADPCSLIDRGALAVHGTVAVHPDVSAFAVCDATISGAGGRVFLTASFDNENQRPYGVGGDLERVGQLTIARRAVLGTCERYILFPDGTGAAISAEAEGGAGAGSDVCAVAETGVRAALDIVTRGSLYARVPLQSRTALAGIEACSLLRADDVDAVLPVADGVGEPGFGGWSCTWLKAGVAAPAFTVVYTHWFPLTDEDGRPVDIGGRAARVTEQPGRTCAVRIPQRTYAENGQDRLETASLTGFGDDPQLCAQMVELANRLVPRLPPMS